MRPMIPRDGSIGQEAEDLGRHVVEDVEQVVAGVEDFEGGIGVVGGELLRVADGNGVVVRAVEDEGGLGEIRVGFEAFAIGQKLVAEFAIAVVGVVEDVDGAGATPGGHCGGTEALGPALCEAEGRGEQDHAFCTFGWRAA
jgi:hypothetical protein